jgi:flagellar export protein FliJ
MNLNGLDGSDISKCIGDTMGIYQSKLKGILLHLKFKVELAEMALAEKNRTLAEEENQLSAIRELMNQTYQNFMEKKAEGILPHEFELYQRFIVSQREKTEKQEKAVQTLLEAYEICREKLALALKEKKVVEKIEIDRYQTYLNKFEKKDQQAMDEIAVHLKGRRR